MKAQQITKQLTALTQVLGFSLGKFNVDVTISGAGAYHQYDRTTGKHTVNIPIGDFANPQYLRMAIGFIYHEIGHGVKTDSSNLQFKHQFEHTLWNALEDIWMERAIGRMSAGAKKRLNDMVPIAREFGIFHGEPMDDPAQSLKSYCLHYCRSKFLGNPVEDFAQIRKAELEAALGTDIVNKITALLDQMEHCESSAEAKRISEEVLKLIQQEEQQKDEQQQQQQEQEQQDEDSTSSDGAGKGSQGEESSGESEDENDSDESSGDDSNESQSDESSDSDGDEQGDDDSNTSESDSSSEDSSSQGASQSKADSSSDDEQGSSSSNEAQPSTEEMLQALKQILGTKAGDKDYHDQIAEKLGELAKEARQEGTAFPFVASEVITRSSHQPLDVPLSTRNLSSKIYSILNKVLVDLARTQDLYTQQGRKLAQKRIAGVQSGNFNVFERKGESKSQTAAVSVLVDGSGSMRHIMHETNQVAYAFAEGLSRGDTPVEVLYFADSHEPIIQAKSFSEKRPDRKRFNINTFGGTDTHIAIFRSTLSLHQQKANNKVMIIITDGEPALPAATAHAVKVALSQGIKVIPILMGVKKANTEGFDQLDCIEIEADPAALAPQLRQAVKRKLFS